MTEYVPAIAVPSENVRDPHELEASKRRRFKAAFVGGSLVLGAVGGFVEWKYGHSIKGWPPPAHSLKHVSVGVVTAAAVEKAGEKFDKKPGAAAIAGTVLAANSATETLQEVFLDDSRHPLAWADHYVKGDNGDDLAASELSALAYYAVHRGLLADWVSVYAQHYKQKILGRK